ncbi:MAG TPA: PEP-CTERM sorting domain-containing protein [Rhizomicrobium sp.]|jgi:hypothetical protein
MNKYMISTAVVALASMALVGAANARTIAASVGGAPTGVSYENFDSIVAPSTATTTLASGVKVSYTGDASAVTGDSSGINAAPYLSGGNGVGFGSQPDGKDTTTYLTAGVGSVRIDMPTNELYLGLLWGSVDDFNTLSFYDSSNNLIDTVTGADVIASPNGDQGLNGTVYVNITLDSEFAYVVASESKNQYAFEFDNLAFNPTDPTVPSPEPITLSLFGAGLAGLGFARRRKA